MCGCRVNPGLNKPTAENSFWRSRGNSNRDQILDVIREL